MKAKNKKSVYNNIVRGLSFEFEKIHSGVRYLTVRHIHTGVELAAPHKFNRTYKNALSVIKECLSGLDWTVSSEAIVEDKRYMQAYKKLSYTL